MIVDKTEGKLDEAKAFAERIGMREQLQEQLDYLDHYGARPTRCLLFPDFAPYSFYFVMEVEQDGEYKRWFNGGCLFHGRHDGFGSGDAPTFSVCLTPTEGWSIHT